MELLMLKRSELELLDALVWASCITREDARKVAEGAASGRMLEYLGDNVGLAHHHAMAIVGGLSMAEWFERQPHAAARAIEQTGRSEPCAPTPTGTHLDCTEIHDVCPHKPETD
jgi:hypothetical protein